MLLFLVTVVSTECVSIVGTVVSTECAGVCVVGSVMSTERAGVCVVGTVVSTECAGVCVVGSVMSTENTYKYHIQVQENTASSSSSLTSASLSLGAQSLHTGPLKQLLKPASGRKAHTGVTSSASERLGSGDHTPTETEMMNVADGDCEDDMPASTNPPAELVNISKNINVKNLSV